MKKIRLSLSGIFRLMGAGVIITALALCIAIVLITRNAAAVLICLITAAVFSVWAFLLVRALQHRLAQFTDEVCQTIDDMMQGEMSPRVIFDDDTMLDRINHQLNRLYQMLQAGKKTIEEQRADLQGMISDISHQVKTPVTNLKMAVSTLLEQALPRKACCFLRTERPEVITECLQSMNVQQCLQSMNVQEYLQSMNVQLDKLDFLMSAMIKSSRLETGVIVLEKQRIPIYETLAVALGSIFLKAEEKHLQVTVDCPDDLIVPHDTKWTAEALFNILENAVKYTPPGGKIQVAAVRWEAYTKIDIIDTGRGIAQKHQAEIFKRFYREPEVHNVEGIGIGLYLAREIISKQGGRIRVTSEAGAGAAFTVFLPND